MKLLLFCWFRRVSRHPTERFITARVAKRAMVMFSQACVTHSVHRGGGGGGVCLLGACLLGGGGWVCPHRGGLPTEGNLDSGESAYWVGGGGLSSERGLPTERGLHQGRPPGGREPGNTVNAWAVCILLDYILVFDNFLFFQI